LLAVATLLGAVPLVLVQSMVGPPRTWNYTLFVLHLSSAIALFYMLKAVQEYVYTGFSKRLRTVITSLVVLSGMGWLGMRAITRNDRIERYVDARSAVNFMVQRLKPDDRVMTDYPWEPAVKFYLLANGVDEEVLYRQPGAGADLYIVVSPADEQTPESVMEHNRWPGEMATSPVKLKDWKRLEIFAARTRTP
jgi:hypothetical protein